jgi:lipid-A-disaccharide synthase
MLVAAEASGDHLGAALASALRTRLPDVRFVGVGGARMAEQGVEGPFDIAELGILGFAEGVLAYPRVLRRVRDTVALAIRERPDVAILIDSWGFTLRVAQRLRRLSRPPILLKYVGPQVWASRPGRARTLAAAVDRLLSIHVFDAPLFERAGLPVTFVGNPALVRDFSRADPAALRARIGAGPADPILLALPGSRRGEVSRLTPVFGAAIGLLRERQPNLKVLIAPAETVAEDVAAQVAAWPGPVELVMGEAARLEAMRTATVALACSGTVTTELALAGCPMVVAYRLGHITHFLARFLIRTRYITLINIAAGAMVAPELIQDACTPKALADQVGERLADPKLRAAQIAAQNAALAIMQGGVADPIGAAADAVVAALEGGGPQTPS